MTADANIPPRRWYKRKKVVYFINGFYIAYLVDNRFDKDCLLLGYNMF